MQGSPAAALLLTTRSPDLQQSGLARRLAVALAAIVAVGAIASGVALDRADTAGAVAAQPAAAHSSSAVERYGQLPMTFEPNAGQTDASVRYLARGAGYTVFLTEREAVLALVPDAETGERTVVRMSTVGGAAHPRIDAIDRHAGRVNYLFGDDTSAWQTDVATFGRIRYSDVYPGIDLVYYGDQQQLEHDFVVRPGAEPGAIGVRYGGIESLELAADGDLLLRTAAGTLRQQAPRAYQEIDGQQRHVESRYVLEDDLVRYEVGAYDPGRALVIDPSVSYSTFLGGTSDEYVNAVAVDGTGAAYVTGRTGSPGFPTTSGAHDVTYTSAGGYDVFVTKLHPTGSSLVYSTYIGGDGVDEGRGIAVDAGGRAFVTGSSSFESGSPAFPLTAGSIRASSDFERGFITVLAAAGNALAYSGTFDAPSGNGIAVHRDPGGTTYAYIVGETSFDGFPTTANAYDRCIGVLDPDFGWCSGGPDGFFMKLIPDGSLPQSSQLVYSTFLGGGASPDFLYDDAVLGVAVDASGRAYLTGRTKTTDFPTTVGAFDRTFNGSGDHLIGDGFVAKLDPSLSGSASLVYST